ncbi:tetratricopeptide repeat protein [Luteolibacter sp. AS25]|uniref:tetratricopeptide repeat protein n=1 Tax=Luteolibacter sp. AS25 TaxID=3135776 RepID=UPI00398A8EF4
METSTANFIEILKDRISSLRDKGDVDEAVHAANAAVEKCESSLSPDPESIEAFADVLEIRAGLYLEMGKYPEAAEDTKQAIDQLDDNADKIGQLGRLYAILGAAYDGQNRHERVIDSWMKAVSYFERHDPPLMMDVAAMTNNLGFTAKAGGDLDSAEDFFLKSLEIMHAEVGPKHEETASVSNNLGAVYLAAGYLEQAREMHMMALETRREIFGEVHPDTAQSHNNLALALLETGDKAWARRHFEKSLAGFESLGEGYEEDLEAVASNYCDFLRNEGEGALAETIDFRVKEVLGKV